MNIDQSLLQFCLKHSDGTGLKEFGERPKEEWEWLKEALANFESPGKKVQKLVEELRAATTAGDDEKTVFLLASLNEELEDVDQAQVVANLGGLELLLALCRHPRRELQLPALTAVQLCLKNNAPVKLKTKNLGGLPHLMHILIDGTSNDLEVRGRALSAISALIDFDRDLQDVFVSAGGVDVASNLLVPENQEKLVFRALFVLRWLLSNRPDLVKGFLGSKSLVEHLQRLKGSANVELNEIATDFYDLLKQ